MKTMVIYGSKHSTTRRVAQHIARSFDGMSCDVEDVDDRILREADRVVIGSPIYSGAIMATVDMFCRDYVGLLSQKELGLFVLGLARQPSLDKRDVERFFLKKLSNHATALGYFGGALTFRDLSTPEKAIARTILRSSGDIDRIDQPTISSFIAKLDN